MSQPHDARAMMEQAGMADVAISLFEHQLAAVRSGGAGVISDAEISPYHAVGLELDAVHGGSLDGVAMIRLNGGLGTSMGLDRAKSLLEVRDGLTFLDVIARQVLALRSATGAALPITFLQSLRTSADCARALATYLRLPIDDVPIELLQNRVPKLRADDLQPIRWPNDPELEWCPPGHGDLYTVLHTSGFLDQLTERGIERVFVANADNLGAVPDARVASWFAKCGAPLAIEAVRRLAGDRKGGHFAIRHRDGRLVLRETAQTPPDELGDIGRHPFASTNNLWFDVAAMHDALRNRDGDLGLPVIVNYKTVDPTDPLSPAVVQLETAMGAAVEVFDDAVAVEVGRDRFIPVKSTDDLLVVRSDCYELTADARLQQAAPSIPFVALGPAYRLIDDFEQRFPAGAPSLIDARSLVVHGDWTFGEGVRVVGDVELDASGGHVPDGELLEGVRR
jgi:UTP--glucose-1-phosphate uridylyltransferase